MAKKRAKIFETKYFGFLIAAFVAIVVALLGAFTGLLDSLELKTLDTHFKLKQSADTKRIQEGSVYSAKNSRISDDILIVGIDFESLTKYGKWPFPRWRHADLVNAFSRIKDQGKRENSLLLDIFFIDPDPDPAIDQALSEALAASGKVWIETILSFQESDPDGDILARTQALYSEKGTLTKIRGAWKEMPSFLSSEPPLPDYFRNSAGYGHANFVPDRDQIFRRQPLVAKHSVLIDYVRLDQLNEGFSVNEAAFERLAWVDFQGRHHTVEMPLTASRLEGLKRELQKSSPTKIEDSNNDGTPDAEFHVLRIYKDYFIPSITLGLALNYFGKDLSDADIILGERIRIDSPTRYDPESGQRMPYEVLLSPDEFDPQGNLVKPGIRKSVPFIEIPIDREGKMLVNFMGPPSNDAQEGNETFPVRSYAGYADRAPGLDSGSWRRTMAAANKILLVGAFAKGIASDERPTPFGLMYGIEIHANALNTIIMGNFIKPAPAWLDYLVLAGLTLLVAFMSSRLSTVLSFFGTMLIIVAFFFGTSFLFEYQSRVINFTQPAMAMIFSFISIVVYRAMTEEREKRMIRETFGKYVSPKVVDQLVGNPPELGGVDKELTVLFSDIRGFTTLSESMSPQELVNHLNVYLTAMTDLILDYGGTLDKYVGDEVMCFWGAPLPQEEHAVLACKCALRQMQKLKELNEGWPEPIRINIGIGLNSGIMTVGNMGSPLRMNYTLMGDNVNLGARLEGTNKEYGTNIIISENTYSKVKDKFIVRELDNIRVKGKNKPVVIYELVDCLESLDPPNFSEKKKA